MCTLPTVRRKAQNQIPQAAAPINIYEERRTHPGKIPASIPGTKFDKNPAG
jgi:hypothetical protein